MNVCHLLRLIFNWVTVAGLLNVCQICVIILQLVYLCKLAIMSSTSDLVQSIATGDVAGIVAALDQPISDEEKSSNRSRTALANGCYYVVKKEMQEKYVKGGRQSINN